MPRKKMSPENPQVDPAYLSDPGGFLHVPISKESRETVHMLKEAMGVAGQADVIEKLLKMAKAIHISTR